jgi:hypothetical protein
LVSDFISLAALQVGFSAFLRGLGGSGGKREGPLLAQQNANGDLDGDGGVEGLHDGRAVDDHVLREVEPARDQQRLPPFPLFNCDPSQGGLRSRVASGQSSGKNL